MNPTLVGMIVFACTLVGVLLGMWLRTFLPEHHLNNDSRDTVKLGAGLIATMTALVLGLVTASAKSSFDTVSTAQIRCAMHLLISISRPVTVACAQLTLPNTMLHPSRMPSVSEHTGLVFPVE